MKIVVVPPPANSAPGITIDPDFLTRLNTALANNFSGGNPGVPPQQDPLFPSSAVVDPKTKTLNEDFDEFGRLLQRGGTDVSKKNNQGLDTFGQGYLDSITETASAGETQVWDFYNTTADTHPWHFHLVNVQIIGRAPISTLFNAPGLFTPPDPNEMGWKETVRMNPGEITRVIMKFTLPNLPTAAMRNAVSPRTGGKEYVHHCHILEHEEHDMMRALVIT
jgi:spore coat protein A